MKSKQSYILNRSIQAMLIAAMLLFVAAVFGTQNTYAAEGDEIDSDQYGGMLWKVIEKSDGTYRMELGSSGTINEFVGESKKIPTVEEFKAMDEEWTARGWTDRIQARQEDRDKYPWMKYDDQITEIEFVGRVNAYGKMDLMFSGMENLKSITGLLNLNTENVWSMSSLFIIPVQLNPDGSTTWSGCPELKVFDYKLLDTGNVLDMSEMFRGCGLEEIDISGFDTTKTVKMFALFALNPSLKKVKMTGIDTSNVYTTQNMFYDCVNLESIEQDIDTSNVENMAAMFRSCEKLKSLDVSNFKTSKVESMNGMFYKCESLTELNVSDFDTSQVTDMGLMFDNCIGLTKIDVSNFDTSKVTSMSYMFGAYDRTNPDYVMALEEIIGLENFDTSNLKTMDGMFLNCRNLEEIQNLDKLDTSNVTSMPHVFSGCSNLTSIDMLDFDLGKTNNALNWIRGCTALEQKIEDIIGDTTGTYSQATKDKLSAIKDNLDRAVAGTATSDEVKAMVTACANEKVVPCIHADEDRVAADRAVSIADQAEKEAEKAKEDLEKAEAEEPQDPAKIKAAQENYDAKAKTAEDLVKAAEEAVAKATASAEKTGDDTIKGNAQAVADALDSVEKAAEDRIADDEVIAAIEDAEKAAKEAARLKEIADNLAKTNPGSDEAIKAAEAANKAAQAAQNAANKAVELANAKGSQERKDAANAAKQNADKAKVEAAKLEAEQKQIKADNLLASNPNSQEAIAAGQAALDAANAYKKDAEAVYGAGSAEANAAQQQVNKATETNNKIVAANDVKPGDQFVFNNQKYEVLTVAANGNGTAALVKGRNAKSVTVPKTASYTEKGKTFDVTEINTKAFYKKTKKVTVGANVDRIDKQAFRGSKVSMVVLKTKELTKKSIKGSLKKSKVKTIKVKVGSKKVNKKFVKKYKKIFTKKNAGKKVTVK